MYEFIGPVGLPVARKRQPKGHKNAQNLRMRAEKHTLRRSIIVPGGLIMSTGMVLVVLVLVLVVLEIVFLILVTVVASHYFYYH